MGAGSSRSQVTPTVRAKSVPAAGLSQVAGMDASSGQIKGITPQSVKRWRTAPCTVRHSTAAAE